MQYKNFKNEISLSRLGMGAMRHCPQSFEIPKYMQEMKQMMENGK